MTIMQMPQTLDGLCEFATILIDAGYLNAATDVVYFFEKPHKWIKEYEIWQGCNEQKPASTTRGAQN